MTTRRQVLLVGAFGVLGLADVRAQARPIRVGMLSPRAKSFFVPVLVRRLGELGYQEGPSMVLEYRHADGSYERYPQLVRELIALNCDLIFAIGDEYGVQSLRGAPMPVIFLAVDYDPVAKGVVKSLSRPGGNVTGVVSLDPVLTLKRLELAQELFPGANRFVALSDVFTRERAAAMKQVADSRHVGLRVHEFEQLPYAYPSAFDTARQFGAKAVILLTSPVFADDRAAIAALSARAKVPVVGFSTPEQYFLAGYSANPTKLGERAAEVGVRVLKGAKPASIPVEQAFEFDLGVNLKVAKALGIAVPYSVLARATKVIE